jgi:hypothetical protein
MTNYAKWDKICAELSDEDDDDQRDTGRITEDEYRVLQANPRDTVTRAPPVGIKVLQGYDPVEEAKRNADASMKNFEKVSRMVARVAGQPAHRSANRCGTRYAQRMRAKRNLASTRSPPRISLRSRTTRAIP